VLESLRDILKQGDNLTLLLLLLTLLVALLLAGGLLLAVRVRTLNRRLARLTRGSDGGDLEATLNHHLELVEQTVRRMETLEQAVGILQAQLPGCLQRTGLVRYDAFDNVGGEQSFSVALLDGHGDGVVLTSVHSRADVRIYAKAIQNGRTTHELSEEEKRALQASWK
jgi:hypothetical protein